MKLRGAGITNNTLLKIIERNPPHYYVNLLQTDTEINKISYDELINITKIFHYSLEANIKINNFLVSNIKYGWSATLASHISKRVYGLCSNSKQKKKLERLYNLNNFNNIFLGVGNNCSFWRKVAPFDIILSLKPIEKIPQSCTKNLSDNGILFLPFYTDKSIKFVKIDKYQSLEETSINYNSIKLSNIL